MRDKIISWLIWAIIWWLIVFWYSYFFNSDSSSYTNNQNSGYSNFPQSWNSMDLSNMSDNRLQRIADKAWISLDKLKQKIKNGDDLSELMPKWNFSWSWNFNRGSLNWWQQNTWNIQTWNNSNQQ